MDEVERNRSPLLVVLAGLLLPGLGYWLVGQRRRALAVGGAILLMYLLGLLVAGVRVVEVPGWDEDGQKVYYSLHRFRDQEGNLRVAYRQVEGQPREGEPANWVLTLNFRGEVFNHIWFVPQSLMGLPTVVAGYLSIDAAQAGVAKSLSRAAEVGTLCTSVAGMLNLLAVIAAASLAAREEEHV
jgi:hypothetical protein